MDLADAAGASDGAVPAAAVAFLSTPPWPLQAPFKVAPLKGVPSLQTALTGAAAGAAAVCAKAEIEKLEIRANESKIFFMTNSPRHGHTCVCRYYFNSETINPDSKLNLAERRVFDTASPRLVEYCKAQNLQLFEVPVSQTAIAANPQQGSISSTIQGRGGGSIARDATASASHCPRLRTLLVHARPVVPHIEGISAGPWTSKNSPLGRAPSSA